MVLTRTLKELWLFGGLDTISDETEEDMQMRRQMKADEEFVVQGFLELLAKRSGEQNPPANGTHNGD